MAKESEPINNSVVPAESIQERIYLIRGQKVMLDADLANLYEVSTSQFNRAIQRNRNRFPEDFCFQLGPEEFEDLRCQFGTSSWGGRRYLPYAFTEHGVAMLSAVLKSDRAVQMSILIVRAFVKMREFLASHRDLAERIERIEATQDHHASVINMLAEEIDLIKAPKEPSKRRIGFDPGA